MSSRSFQLYDTMTRSVKELRPIEENHLKFYSCGPTVYNYAHIGNFRTYLTADLVIRTAKAIGWKVTYISNITDVGHMTQDDLADAGGEDKMEKALKSKEGEQFPSIWDMADYYARALESDWDTLNLLRPNVRPRATQYMREQILAVQQLIESGNAYETPTGVYFDVSSDPNYGELSGNKSQESLMRNVRDVVQDPHKKHPADFALWKKDDKHLMQWYSPWGWGFPGWHLECSVMSRIYLGDTIDLHGGGEDLVFPHHECEIAQSECMTHKKFSNHWLHTRYLQVEGEKMSKSKGNFFTVRDLVEGQGIHPLALRWALIAAPYGKPYNFTMQELKNACNAISRFQSCVELIEEALSSNRDGDDMLGENLTKIYNQAIDAMCDDLNTAIALAKAYEGTKCILKDGKLSKPSAESARAFLENINSLLGVVYSQEGQKTCHLSSNQKISPEEVEVLLEQRKQAREDKNFARSDEIRDILCEKGIEIRDSPEGTSWKYKV